MIQRVERERQRERERPLVRKAITCSLKEQMESFCASFPPFPLPSAYLNDMSSPNIQLLSWEFPPCSLSLLSMWVPGGVCGFASLLCASYQSKCVCVCVHAWVCGWMSVVLCVTIWVWSFLCMCSISKLNLCMDMRLWFFVHVCSRLSHWTCWGFE